MMMGLFLSLEVRHVQFVTQAIQTPLTSNVLNKPAEAQKRDMLLAQSSDDTFMITSDLQKTLPLPRLSTITQISLHWQVSE